MKIIDARIRTTKKTHTVFDGHKFKNQTYVTFRPQVQYKFFWFSWWHNATRIECTSYTYAMKNLVECIKNNHNDVVVVEKYYEYIKVE